MSKSKGDKYALSNKHAVFSKELDATTKEIEVETYDAIKNAKKGLIKWLELEEHYDLVKENYLEYFKEICLLNLSNIAGEKMGPDFYIHAQKARMVMNRRLINLLATVRLYSEFLEKQLRFNKKKASQLIKQEVESEFFNDYEFMSELRHTTQHFSAPIKSVTFGIGSKPGDQKIQFHVTKEFLEEHERFGKKVRRKMKDRVEINETIANYIEVISRLHINIRKESEGNITADTKVIEDLFSSPSELNIKESIYINKIIGDEVKTDYVVSMDQINARTLLESKNKFPLWSSNLKNMVMI
ncbi:MAG: hypothetical protein O3A01_07370 [bacterium]|nr:hypothetical protein [bacterium]